MNNKVSEIKTWTRVGCVSFIAMNFFNAGYQFSVPGSALEAVCALSTIFFTLLLTGAVAKVIGKFAELIAEEKEPN